MKPHLRELSNEGLGETKVQGVKVKGQDDEEGKGRVGRREAAEHCPQQAEAPGSAKAKGVTRLRGSDPPPPFPNNHFQTVTSPEERKAFHAGGGMQGREEDLQHTWCGLS